MLVGISESMMVDEVFESWVPETVDLVLVSWIPGEFSILPFGLSTSSFEVPGAGCARGAVRTIAVGPTTGAFV